MLESMPIRTRLSVGGSARLGATARAAASARGQTITIIRGIRMGLASLFESQGVAQVGECESIRAGSRGWHNAGRRRDDAGVETARGDALEVGQGENLVVERFVVSGLGLAGEDVGL